MYVLLITLLCFGIGAFFIIRHFVNRQKEEAISDILIATGTQLTLTCFGTFNDKLFAFLSDTEAATNYVQLVVGIFLVISGIVFHLYIKNKLYILNINGYFDKRIEQHHHELGLNHFQFKEREIDFIRVYKKGINKLTSKDIIDEIKEKVATFKAESKDKSRAYTGIAPIPFIFVAGKEFSREKFHRYFEYDKFNNIYYSLTPCNKRKKPYSRLRVSTNIATISSSGIEDVVLVVSITQQILDSDLSQFAYPKIHVAVDNPSDNKIKYTNQLDEYTMKIYETIKDLPGHFPDLKRIHLVYSGQSCLALEVGKLLDDTRNKEIISYQFISQNNPVYAWGIVVNGQRKGAFIKC